LTVFFLFLEEKKESKKIQEKSKLPPAKPAARPADFSGHPQRIEHNYF
jgi:hypothetical protein